MPACSGLLTTVFKTILGFWPESSCCCAFYEPSCKSFLGRARLLAVPPRTNKDAGFSPWGKAGARRPLSVLRILLPTRQHGNEVIPAVQNHHHEMPEHKSQDRPH